MGTPVVGEEIQHIHTFEKRRLPLVPPVSAPTFDVSPSKRFLEPTPHANGMQYSLSGTRKGTGHEKGRRRPKNRCKNENRRLGVGATGGGGGSGGGTVVPVVTGVGRRPGVTCHPYTWSGPLGIHVGQLAPKADIGVVPTGRLVKAPL